MLRMAQSADGTKLLVIETTPETNNVVHMTKLMISMAPAIPISFQSEDNRVMTGALVYSSSVAWIRAGLKRVENTLEIAERRA